MSNSYNIIRQMCCEDGCKTIPNFNNESDTKALYCSVHKKHEWEERLLVLEQHINYWINPENITNKTIETIHLYYDV